MDSECFTDCQDDGVSFVTDANDPSQTIIKVYAATAVPTTWGLLWPRSPCRAGSPTHWPR